MPSLLHSIGKNSVLLGFVVALSTAATVMTFMYTRTTIIEQEEIARSKALREILPTGYDNNLLASQRQIAPHGLLGETSAASVFTALAQGKPVAVILSLAAPDGYTGPIQLLVGVNKIGNIAGVRVTSHKETPGLGDKIELTKSDWILVFNGRSLTDPLPPQWRVRKDGGEFDGLTGATITPRAIVKAVRNTLQYVAENRVHLFDESPTD